MSRKLTHSNRILSLSGKPAISEASDCLRSRNLREKGTVLIVALFVTCALLIMAVPSIFKLLSYYSLTEKSHRSLAALHLAEAGIERAIWELNFGDITTWEGTSENRTLAISSFQPYSGGRDGSIEVVVEDPASANPVIEAVGRIEHQPPRRIEKRIRVVLEEREIPFFDYGVFAFSHPGQHRSKELPDAIQCLPGHGMNNSGCSTIRSADRKAAPESVASATCGRASKLFR